MLFLEGNIYKSVIIQELLRSKPNSLAFIYGTIDIHACDNVYQFADQKFNASKISGYVEALGCDKNKFEYIIIYTNEPRMFFDYNGIKDVFKEIEKYCDCLVVTCKTDE